MIQFLREVGKWTRFAYFLRFAWLIWLFAPILCFLNIADKTLTSGILVAEFWQQYLCIGFFLVSAGFTALVLARIVLINGPERWDLQAPDAPSDCRPAILRRVFVNDEGKFEAVAVGVSQVPNLFVFAYLLHFGVCQDIDAGSILGGLLAGALLAGIFWWNANAWYYLTFKEPPAPEGQRRIVFRLGDNAARTILFPRSWFRLNPANAALEGKPTIEQARTMFSRPGFEKFDSILGFAKLRQLVIDRRGYSDRARGNSFYEAHNFAIISFFVFLGLYLLIWPLTAPVAAPAASIFGLAVSLLFVLAVIAIFCTAEPATVGEQTGKLKRIQIWIACSVGVFYITVLLLYLFTEIDRFPIFATVLILVTAVGWGLGAVAFFFDRYRVPVLTVLLLSLVLPRMFHLDRTLYIDATGLHAGNGQEEHYVSIASVDNAAPLPSPADILKLRREAAGDDRPLIIVTATGGGLHASAWTATVLAHLEHEFGADFHKHLLLASTVSGGSVGLMPYLREMYEGNLDRNPDLAEARMVSVAQCSSLEGVGWGLVFYDLPKAFVPIFPYFVSPSSGDGDLDTNGPARTPLGKDRTWGLRKSFLRNMDDAYCKGVWESDNPRTKGAWHTRQEGANGSSLLAEIQAKLVDPTGNGRTIRSLPGGEYPAFAMNTTVVETGERFLSANYRIPDCQMEEPPSPDYHARSFLQTFSRRIVDGKQAGWADLPLASAAQLSATFPYVSSAARAPMVVDNAVNSVHFADGGYYDNDGTASALEFLRYALGPVRVTQPPQDGEKRCPVYAAPAAQPVRILLIEIRNSDAIHGSGPESIPDHNGGSSPWNLFSQVGAPLLGFWQAGHESITPRNQAALELLEHAYAGKVLIQPVVLADEQSTATVGTDPLNWSLTPRQRKEVRDSARSADMAHLYAVARQWFEAPRDAWDKPPLADGSPQVEVAQCSTK